MWLGIHEPGRLPTHEARGFVRAWLTVLAGAMAVLAYRPAVGLVLLELLGSDVGECGESAGGCR